MKPLSDTDDSIIVRTDFSNDGGWTSIQEAIKQTIDRGVGRDASAVLSMFDFLSDTGYDGATPEALMALVP
jgi:hypothetical protein